MTQQQAIETKIVQFDPRTLVLLQRNARFMRHEQFARLVQNVKSDGRLTSVPFAVRQNDGKYQVLSGNHRVRAAIEAGLSEIDVMVTDDQLTEAQKIAIQLSHNAIVGEDDPAVLKALYESIEEIDWQMYSGLDDKTLELLDKVSLDSISEANLDYQTLSIVFLPDEIERAKNAIDEALTLTKAAKKRWLAAFAQHEQMLDALVLTQESHNIANVATALGLILDVFDRHKADVVEGWWDEETQSALHNHWVPLEPLVGSTAPASVAAIIKQAIDRCSADERIKSGWQALELICADYLASSPQ